MKLNWIVVRAVAFCFFTGFFSGLSFGMSPELKPGQEVFILNAENQPLKLGQFPKNWRTFQSKPKSDRSGRLTDPKPSMLGMEPIRASGSGQFSEAGLQAILAEIAKVQGPSPIILIDLRQESHGFINGSAVSWYGRDDALNAGKTLDQIQEDEKRRFAKILKGRSVSIKKWSQEKKRSKVKEDAHTLVAQIAETEKQLVERLFASQSGQSVTYLRLPSPDHQRPSDSEVEAFLAFYLKQVKPQGNPSPSPSPLGRPWLHFHCAAGQGRTTSYLAMVDMIENAKQVSAHDILSRQWLLGGKDLRDFEGARSKKKKWAIDRLEFLYEFYEYCRESQPEFKKSWGDWVRERKSRKKISARGKGKNGAEEVLNLDWRSTLLLGRPPEVKTSQN